MAIIKSEEFVPCAAWEQKPPPIIQCPNWPTLKQTAQSSKRIGTSSMPALTDLPSNVRSRQTSNRRRAQEWTNGRTNGRRRAKALQRAESVVSYDEDVRKLIHQTVQIRCQRTRAATPTTMMTTTTSTGHVFNVARHDGWLWLWPTSRPIRAHCVDDHSIKTARRW